MAAPDNLFDDLDNDQSLQAPGDAEFWGQEEDVTPVPSEGEESDPMKQSAAIREWVDDLEGRGDRDAFSILSNAARREGDRFKADDSLQVSSKSRELFRHLGRSELASSETIAGSYSRKYSELVGEFEGFKPTKAGSKLASGGVTTGFVSRAGVEEYKNLLDVSGEFKGVFFQFQQRDLAAQVMKRSDPTTILTQALDFNESSGTDLKQLRTRASILAGNELLEQMSEQGRQSGRTNLNIETVKTAGAFHPKVGYVGDPNQKQYAFIGTQNITNALARRQSIESLLIFENVKDPTTAWGRFEAKAAREIIAVTDAAMSLAKTGLVRPGALQQEMSGIDRSFIYTNTEIQERWVSVLQQAEKTQDKVVISMGEIALLASKNPAGDRLKSSLSAIAKQGRLTLVTNEVGLRGALSSPGTDQAFLKSLIESPKGSALRVAATRFHHDKAIAIYGTDSNLKFLSDGSANFSMRSISKISESGADALSNMEKVYGQMTQSERDSTANTELVFAVGIEEYADKRRGLSGQMADDTAEYLRQLGNPQGDLGTHFNTLSGGRLFNDRATYNVGYVAERGASVENIRKLKSELDQLTKVLGEDSVLIQERYATDRGLADPVGLSVTIKGANSPFHSIGLDLTIGRSGNVIVSNYNKVIAGSVYVNQTAEEKTVGRTLVPARSSRQLDSIDTTKGLVATLAYQMDYLAQHGLANLTFDNLVMRDVESEYAARSASKLTAELFARAVPQLKTKSGEKANLYSLVEALRVLPQSSGTDLTTAATKVQLMLARGELSGEGGVRLSEDAIAARFDLLTAAFSAFEPSTGLMAGNDALARGLSSRAFTSGLVQALRHDQHGLLDDIKLALVMGDPEAKAAYIKAAQTQSRSTLREMLSPFLAMHELGYSGYQAQTRLPVYGEQETGRSPLGLLDPLPMRAGSYVGPSGTYYRAIGATAYGKPLSSPGYGGIASLNVIDSDLSTGAAVVHDMQSMMQSTAGMTLLTKDNTRAAIERILKLSGTTLSAEQLEQMESRLDEYLARPLYALPFAKLDQIPQRLKNVQGARPALDFNPEFAADVRAGRIVSNTKSEHILGGRLREVLPAAQYQEVLNVKAELEAEGKPAGYEEVQAEFRRREADPSETRRGFIGGRKMKRVAINAGISLMGDFSYGNAGYQQDVGSTTVMRLHVNFNSMAEKLQIQSELSKLLAPGSRVYGSAQTVEGLERASILLQLGLDESTVKSIGDTELNRRLAEAASIQGADSYFFSTKESMPALMRKSGLYVQEEGRLVRRGEFNEDGLIRVQDLNRTVETIAGPQQEPIFLKFPAFNKRYEQGVSVSTELPHFTVRSGNLVIETSLANIWTPGSGSRVIASGGGKGPLDYRGPALFNAIDASTAAGQTIVDNNVKSYREFVPRSIADDSYYSLSVMSTFKGFSAESGIWLLSQDDSRAALSGVGGEEVARSLALLFLGDAPTGGSNTSIKAALQQNLRGSGLAQVAFALESAKGFDISKINPALKQASGEGPSVMGQLALGLNLLQEGDALRQGVINQDLSGLKQLVIKALQSGPGQSLAQEQLRARTSVLLNAPLTGDGSTRFDGGQVLLNEADPINRSAGLVAHVLFTGRQLFSDRTGPNTSVGRIYERDFSNVQAYINDPDQRNVVDMAAIKAGIKLDRANPVVFQQQLKRLQAIQENDVILESIHEMTVSKSLVPAGMDDTVKLEFQYLSGLSSKYLKAFERAGGATEDGVTVQSAFMVLSAAANGSLMGAMATNAGLQFRLGIIGDNAAAGEFTGNALGLRKFLMADNEVARSLGLSDRVIESLKLGESAAAELEAVMKSSRLATGAAPGEVTTVERATQLANQQSFAYLATDLLTESSILQRNNLISFLGVDSLSPNIIHSLAAEADASDHVRALSQQYTQAQTDRIEAINIKTRIGVEAKLDRRRQKNRLTRRAHYQGVHRRNVRRDYMNLVTGLSQLERQSALDGQTYADYPDALIVQIPDDPELEKRLRRHVVQQEVLGRLNDVTLTARTDRINSIVDRHAAKQERAGRLNAETISRHRAKPGTNSFDPATGEPVPISHVLQRPEPPDAEPYHLISIAQDENKTRAQLTDVSNTPIILAREQDPKEERVVYLSSEEADESKLVMLPEDEASIKRKLLAPPAPPTIQQIASIDVVADALSQTYTRYQAYAKETDGRLELVNSFREFFNESNTVSSQLKDLDKRYGFVEKITTAEGNLRSLTATDRSSVRRTIESSLQSVNQASVAKVQQTLDTSASENYLRNALELETKLVEDSNVDPQKHRLLQELQRSKQIVLPQFEGKLITEGQNQGMYRLVLRSAEQADPTTGILMGTDLLRNASLVFGDYKHEVLTKQMELVQKLADSEQLQRRVFASAKPEDMIVNAAELGQLEDLATATAATRLSTTQLLTTDLTRRAMGDVQNYKGAVGISTGSFALAADTVALGSRFGALVREQRLGEAIENQAKLIVSASTSEEIDRHKNRLIEMAAQIKGDAGDGAQRQSEQLENRLNKVLSAHEQGKLGGSGSAADIIASHVYSNITGKSVAQTYRKRQTEAGRSASDRELAMYVGGAARRSGSPAGSSYEVAEGINSKFISGEAYNRKLSELTGGKSLLDVDETRFATGSMIPAISRVLAGLGDFDGDSYQFLISSFGERATQVADVQRQLLGQQNALKRIERLMVKRAAAQQQLDPNYDLELEAKKQQVVTKIRDLNIELDSSMERMHANRLRAESIQQRALGDVRSFVKGYLALPDILTGETLGDDKALSTGEMVALLKQKFDTGQWTDGQPHIKAAEERINLFSRLFDESQGGFRFDSTALHDSMASTYTQLLDPERSGKVSEAEVQQVLAMARNRGGTMSGYQDALTSYYYGAANLGAAFDTTSGSLKKAAGTTINAFDFEGVQSLIGKGGTELIGKTYNALIPLLDRAMMTQGLVAAADMSGQADEALKISLGGEDDELYKKLRSGEFKTRAKQQVLGTSSFLSNMQQMIRDALKAKDESSLLSILKDRNVGQLLDSLPDDLDPREADKQRVALLQSILEKEMGPQIALATDSDPFLSAKGEDSQVSRLRTQMNQPLDTQMTGFGAVIGMAQFFNADDADLGTLITKKGLQSHYESLRDAGVVKGESEYLSRHLQGLVERTQAAFAADSIVKEGGLSRLVDNATATYDAYFNQAEEKRATLSAEDNDRLALIGEYKDIVGKEGRSDTLDRRLVEEIQLREIHRINEDTGVFNAQSIAYLREVAQANQVLQYGIDTPDQDTIGGRLALGNRMSYNALIRRLRRGQAVDAVEAAYMGSSKMNNLSSALSEFGVDALGLSPEDREKALMSAGLLDQNLFNEAELKRLIPALTQTVSMSGADGKTREVSGMQAVAEGSAGVAKMYSLLDQRAQLGADDEAARASIDAHLNRLLEGGKINVDSMQQMLFDMQADPAAATKGLSNRTQAADPPGRYDNINFRPSVGMEMIGSLIGPLVFAAAASDIPLDQRAGQLAFDTVQAVAQITSDRNRLTTALSGGEDKSLGRAFQTVRIRQAIETEGYAIGAAQAYVQESLFKGFSQAAYGAIDWFNRGVGKNMSVGRGVGTVFAEVAATILSQSAVRALTKQRATKDGDYMSDIMSRLLASFVEQVWQAVQEAQEAALDPEYEVIDTDENSQLDIDTTAYLSPLQADIESGYVVLDADSTPISSEFEDAQTEWVSQASSIKAA